MATETVFDKQTKLEVGEVVAPFPSGPLSQPHRVSTSTPLKYAAKAEWIKRQLTEAEPRVKRWREDAYTAYAFVAGNQYNPDTRRVLRLADRPDTAFNSIQKYIRHISGLERRSPQALLCFPLVVDNLQQQILGEFTSQSFEWAMKRCHGSFERSRAFEDLITGGMGWTSGYIDRQIDSRGLVDIVRISPFETLWPDCPDENLRSTRWRAYETWIDVDDAVRRWSDHELLLRARAGQSGSGGGTDLNTFPERDFTRYTVPYVESEPIDKSKIPPERKGKLQITEFQWLEDEDGYLVTDPRTGEPVWLPEAKYRLYDRRVRVIDPMRRLAAEKASHRVCYVAYLLDRQHLLADPARLPNDRFTLNVMCCHFDEETRQWYGYVRILMDPQRYANKFFNQVIEIMGTSAKSGATAERIAFENPTQQKDFARDYSKAGSLSIVAPDALKEGRIKEKTPAQMPGGAMAIIEFCVSSMESVTGLATAAMGADGGMGQLPAMTMRQRQDAGMVLLASEFDSLSRYRYDEARTVIAMLGLVADNRLVKIGGPLGGAKILPLFQDPFLLDYELELDDTEHDPSLRQRYQNFIMQAAPMLAKQGLFVPSMFSYMPFPVKVRQEIIQSMERQQQQRQQAAAQGINLTGRGQPRDPREVAARIQKLQGDAALHRAKAAAILGDSRRNDLKQVVDAIGEYGGQRLKRDQHGLAERRHGLDERKHITDTVARIFEAMQQSAQGGGGGE